MNQLWKSFRLSFLRRPDTFDFFCCSLFSLGYFVCGAPRNSVLSAALGSFLTLRAIDFITNYSSVRWPRQYEKVAYPSLVAGGVLFAVWLIFLIDWQSVAQMRPDWQGAWFILKMGAAVLCFFGPLMWLLDHVFKPFARRTGQHVLGAIGFVAICGMWWSGLVLGLLALKGNTWW